MKAGKGEAGYILIFLLAILSSLPLILMFSVDVITRAEDVSENMQTDLTILRLGMLKTAVINQGKDPDRDNYLEPLSDDGNLPVDGDGNPLPLTEGRPLPLKMKLALKDGWDSDILYCHWDLGPENAIDPNYSQNFFAPPISGLIARLISPGENKSVETNCTDSRAAGDDLVENIFNSDARTYSR